MEGRVFRPGRGGKSSDWLPRRSEHVLRINGNGNSLTGGVARPHGDMLCRYALMAPLSYTGLFVLQALAQGRHFGFDIMDATGLPSGTVYPALRRLEAMGFVESSWEDDGQARRANRPRRQNYQLTKTARAQLVEAETRFRAVSKLFPGRSRT